MNLPKSFLSFFVALTICITLMGSGFVVHADSNVSPCDPTQPTPCQPSDNPSISGTITLSNPLGDVSDPRVIIGNIIKTVLGIVGSLALVLFIYGGLMMMTSAGNSDRVSKGRNTLVWATIGLLVIFGSYTIVAYLLAKISQH